GYFYYPKIFFGRLNEMKLKRKKKKFLPYTKGRIRIKFCATIVEAKKKFQRNKSLICHKHTYASPSSSFEIK
ncbi:hypothetical protein DERF_004907, partial [Dermatophagoides farinae]